MYSRLSSSPFSGASLSPEAGESASSAESESSSSSVKRRAEEDTDKPGSSHPPARYPTKRAKLCRNTATLQLPPDDPKLAWLTKNDNHTNVVLPIGRVMDARHLFQKTLEGSDKTVLYIHNSEAHDNLKSSVVIDHGQPKLVAGPFQKLIDSGGVLMLNVAHFSPQQLEAFNTLMEEKKWEGKALDKPVRVLCLCDTDTLTKNVLSGAQISRTVFQDMADFPFEKSNTLQLEKSLDTYPKETKFIDLQHDPMWSRRLLGGPSMNDRQQWEDTPAALSDAGTPYVLRNLPDDPYLMDELLKRKAQQWNIRLEEGLPEQEITTLVANKQPATQVQEILTRPDAPVCIVNESTLEEVLESHYGVIEDGDRKGGLKKHPSLLAQTQAQLNTHMTDSDSSRVSIFVTDSLPGPLWDRMMQHPVGFDVAAAPDVEVPPRYATCVSHAEYAEKMHCEVFSKPVGFMHCADPALWVRNQLHDTATTDMTLLFVTPTMRGDALLYTLQPEVDTTSDATSSAEEGSAPPSLSIKSLCLKTHRLVEDLKNGKRVVLQGLENNPALTRELATLLHPPHYLYINGKRLHFGPGGGLTGRLAVLTIDELLVQRHPLSPSSSDPIGTDNWQGQVCNALQQQFRGHTPEQITEGVDRLVKLFEIFSAQGLMPKQDPPISYLALETLYRRLNAADKENSSLNSEQVSEQVYTSLITDKIFIEMFGQEHLKKILGGPLPIRPPLTRALLKDLLIGDYRQTGKVQDTRYTYLKICLRVMFPKQMEHMPVLSFDTTRLYDLLRKVNHPKDIVQNSWLFLHTFSLDIVQAIIGDELSETISPKDQEDIGNKVLALVLDQAYQRGYPLPPVLEHARIQSLGQSPINLPLFNYDRTLNRPHDERNLAKANLLLSQGNAAFLKGPPGTGKTHQINQLLAGSAHTINIADEGTPKFDQILAEWARSPGPATLVIDEANLAGPENLAMLKSVFANRTIYADGKVYPLRDDHRILFTGNDDSLPGRTSQQVAKESIPTLQHKAIPSTTLRKIFIDPLMDKGGKEFNIERPLKDLISSQILTIHDHLQRAFPERELSPRNLEEFTAQLLSVMSVLKEKSGEPLQHVGPWLASLALNVYANDVSPEDRDVITVWLRHQLALEISQQELPVLPTNVDLGKTSLADTPSTMDLAHKISWWLTTQDKRQTFNPKKITLGQAGLLIEGPASRGKDTVVEAILKVHDRPYVHINANPNNLQLLHEVLSDAYTTGKVVLISELNLLPSGILESELNALLTGHTDTPAHPKFALIATVNPGDYAGRKPLSGALKNRMQHILVDDYLPEELSQIAEFIAKQLSDKPISGNIKSKVPPETTEKLVWLHLDLIAQLQNQPSEFRPGIRQLRGALEQIQSQPKADVSTVFDANYAYYQAAAKELSTQDLDQNKAPTTAHKTAVKQKQLQRALSLAHPEWIAQPEFSPGLAEKNLPPRENGASHIFQYDVKDHVLYFDEHQSAQRLCGSLLRSIRNGLYVGDSARAVALASNRAESNTRTSMKPALGRSGAGQPRPKGNLGRILHSGEARTYLPTSRESLAGTLLQIYPDPKAFNNAARILATDSKIELTEVPTIQTQAGTRIAYLLATDRARPTDVEFDGQPPLRILRDRQGGWYCEIAVNQASIPKISYRLTSFQGGGQLQAPTAQFSGLDPTKNKDLLNEINRLRNVRRDRTNTVTELERFFKQAFTYSDDDAEALDDTANRTARSQRFIEKGQGVCYEFASAFAAVLEQEFQIPARLCSGYVTKNGNIPVEGHLWVEYCDTQGNWHQVDPTAASLSSTNDDNHLDHDAPVDSPANSENEKLIFSNERSIVPRNAASHGFEYISRVIETPHHFSLEKLNLINWTIQRKGASYNACRGTLDVKRLLQGEPNMFRDAALGSNAQPRALYITDLPPLENMTSWKIFISRILTPLQALLESGVPIYIADYDHNFVKITRAKEIANAHRADVTGKLGLDTADNLIVNTDSHGFFERLATHYYESVFSAEGIDVDNEDAVKACIFSRMCDFKHYDGFPLQIIAHNKKWELTLDDFETHLINTASISLDEGDHLVDLALNFMNFQRRKYDSSGLMARKLHDLIKTETADLNVDQIQAAMKYILMSVSNIHDDTFFDVSLPLIDGLVKRLESRADDNDRLCSIELIENLTIYSLRNLYESDNFQSDKIDIVMRVYKRFDDKTIRIERFDEISDCMDDVLKLSSFIDQRFFNNLKSEFLRVMETSTMADWNNFMIDKENQLIAGFSNKCAVAHE